MLREDGTINDEIVESIFDEAVLQMFQEPIIKYAISAEQKRKVLEALDIAVDISEDGKVVSIGLLFFKVTIDDSGASPELGINFEMDKLLEFHSKLPKK